MELKEPQAHIASQKLYILRERSAGLVTTIFMKIEGCKNTTYLVVDKYFLYVLN